MAAPAPLVMVCANQAWNLVHYRGGLIRALLADGYRILAVAPPDPICTARLEAMGCAVAPLPLDPAGLSPLRELRTLAALAALVRRHRPAALLTWTIKPNIYGALAAAGTATAALPNVSGLGTAFLGPTMLTRIAGLLCRLAFRRCAAVFFQNREDLGLFTARGLVRPEQARLLPGSGVDLARFSPVPRQADGRRHFVMIARLLADKGVREFAEAARMVREGQPDCRFTLVGPLGVANRSAIAAAEVADWQAEGVLEHLGAVEDVRPVIAAADWIVLPSYSEGMPRTLLEAAAMARPLVATDVPGCRDIAIEGDTGFTATPRDAAALAEALLRAARTDDAGWQRMAAAARARAAAQFSEDVVIDAYRDALRAVGTDSHPQNQAPVMPDLGIG